MTRTSERIVSLANDADRAEQSYGELARRIRSAVEQESPGNAAIHCGIAMEHLIRTAHSAALPRSDGSGKVAGLISTMRRAALITEAIADRMYAVQTCRNKAAHGEPVEQASVEEAFEKLHEVVDWFLDQEEHPSVEFHGQVEQLRGYETWLPRETVERVLNDYPHHLAQLGRMRAEHRAELQRWGGRRAGARRSPLKRPGRELHEPAWTTLATTDSRLGRRLVIGFSNDGCSYRENDGGLGCLSCGFYAGARPLPRAERRRLLTRQFREGVAQGIRRGLQPDVIEFLSDGSFLSEREMQDDVKSAILAQVGKMAFIDRVLVESRPEYVKKKELAQRLRNLSPGQKLEIGIGLESRDEFIRNGLIRKGIELSKFEQAVSAVADANEEFTRNREPIDIVCYLLLKPAYLSEWEALQDAMHTIRYLAELSERTSVRITPKVEPAVIARGTLLDLLYRLPQEAPTYYAPLSYWTVLELLVRVFEDPSTGSVGKRIRVGSRQDMDDVRKMPAAYRWDGKLSKYDFIVYGAIQEFNHLRELPLVVGLLDAAYQDQNQDMLQPGSSFMRWADGFEQMAGEPSAILGFMESQRQAMEASVAEKRTLRHRDLNRGLFRVLDILEHETKDRVKRRLRRLKAYLLEEPGRGDEVLRKIEEVVRDEFVGVPRVQDAFVRVEEFEFEDDEDELLRIELDVTDVRAWESHSVFATIPIG